jgi:hypothetical protein
MAESNKELFRRRIEPESLKGQFPNYITLRTTKDAKLLKELVSYLENQLGKDHVIVPWLTPPHGTVVGYGVYSIEEAEILTKRSNDENWGNPEFGRIYDVHKLEDRISRLNGTYKD